MDPLAVESPIRQHHPSLHQANVQILVKLDDRLNRLLIDFMIFYAVISFYAQVDHLSIFMIPQFQFHEIHLYASAKYEYQMDS